METATKITTATFEEVLGALNNKKIGFDIFGRDSMIVDRSPGKGKSNQKIPTPAKIPVSVKAKVLEQHRRTCEMVLGKLPTELERQFDHWSKILSEHRAARGAPSRRPEKFGKGPTLGIQWRNSVPANPAQGTWTAYCQVPLNLYSKLFKAPTRASAKAPINIPFDYEIATSYEEGKFILHLDDIEEVERDENEPGDSEDKDSAE